MIAVISLVIARTLKNIILSCKAEFGAFVDDLYFSDMKMHEAVTFFKIGCFECNGEMATSEDDAGHRGIIKYCVVRGMTPGQFIQTHQNVSRVLIFKWHRRFSTGWSDIGTKKGRPTAISSAGTQNVSELIRTDRRQTVREIFFLCCGYK